MKDIDNNQDHLLLVDGMALLFRSFYATSVTGQFMYNAKGVPTNAVQGMMKHLFYALDAFDPTHLVFCWDMGSKTFRNELYDAYKANRSAAPDELIPQFDLAKEIVEAFLTQNIGLKGYEADDCMGTIAKKLKNENVNVSILTGDKDLLQVVDDHTDVILLQKGFGNYKKYDKARFIEEYGLQPVQLVEVKALMGDPSDGYPGVKGIGEKTAIKLIKAYDTVDGVIENLHLLPKGQKTKIETDLEALRISRKLAEIHCEVPIEFQLSNYVRNEVASSFHESVEAHELKLLKNIVNQRRSISML